MSPGVVQLSGSGLKDLMPSVSYSNPLWISWTLLRSDAFFDYSRDKQGGLTKWKLLLPPLRCCRLRFMLEASGQDPRVSEACFPSSPFPSSKSTEAGMSGFLLPCYPCYGLPWSRRILSFPIGGFCCNSRMTARECELRGERNKYFQNSILILPISYLSRLHWIFWNEKQGQKVHMLYPILVSQLQVTEWIWKLPHEIWSTIRAHR